MSAVLTVLAAVDPANTTVYATLLPDLLCGDSRYWKPVFSKAVVQRIPKVSWLDCEGWNGPNAGLSQCRYCRDILWPGVPVWTRPLTEYETDFPENWRCTVYTCCEVCAGREEGDPLNETTQDRWTLGELLLMFAQGCKRDGRVHNMPRLPLQLYDRVVRELNTFKDPAAALTNRIYLRVLPDETSLRCCSRWCDMKKRDCVTQARLDREWDECASVESDRDFD